MNKPEEDFHPKRQMPEHLRKFMIKVQGGKSYLPAAYRLAWFRDECPNWGIETHLLEGGQHAGFATVQAKVTNESGFVIATAHKTETQADFPAGWVEKAETGAVARALSMAGFGTHYSQDLDENGHMANGNGDWPANGSRKPRDNRPPPAPEQEFWSGPGQCPHCHAPVGKRHGKPCVA